MSEYKAKAKKCYEDADYQGYVDFSELQYTETNHEDDLMELNKAKKILQIHKEIQNILKMNGKDSYKILGISPNATITEIKKVFREKASRYHPNRISIKGSQDAFRIIQEAYFEINTEEKKKEYDEKLRRKANKANYPQPRIYTSSQPGSLFYSFENGSFTFSTGFNNEFYPFQIIGSDFRQIYSNLYRNTTRQRSERPSIYITILLIAIFVFLSLMS